MAPALLISTQLSGTRDTARLHGQRRQRIGSGRQHESDYGRRGAQGNPQTEEWKSSRHRPHPTGTFEVFIGHCTCCNKTLQCSMGNEEVYQQIGRMASLFLSLRNEISPTATTGVVSRFCQFPAEYSLASCSKD